jgi:hypothetical protein
LTHTKIGDRRSDFLPEFFPRNEVSRKGREGTTTSHIISEIGDSGRKKFPALRIKWDEKFPFQSSKAFGLM